MRVHRVFIIFAISIGCGIPSQNVAFSQEYRGTAEQQMACTPDVWRLCGAQIPDADRIVACLRRNTAQLSEPCRAVIEPTANSPRRRDDQPLNNRRNPKNIPRNERQVANLRGKNL